MALDFGDAGLFDPLPTNNKHKSKREEDDENDNIHSNGWNNDDDNDRDVKDHDGEPDEPDEEDLGEDWPSAPPLDILDCIKGYEMVSFDATSVPPPPFEEVVEETIDGAEEGKGEDKDGEDDGIKPKVGKSH